MALTALIDADILVYKEAAAGQKDFKWDNGAESRHVAPFEDVKENAEKELAKLVQEVKATAVILCFTDTVGNFRKKLYPPYKATRREKPEHHKALMEYLMAEYPSYWRPGLEGDDIMGILATHPTLVKGPKVVVSIDKDMNTIPCDLYNPGKGTRKRVTVEEADYSHLFQTLTGDSVDEYPGCPRIGPTKAAQALEWGQEEGLSAWQSVVGVYESRGLTEADALVQARCARILRHTDYNFKTKEPILWTPQK